MASLLCDDDRNPYQILIPKTLTRGMYAIPGSVRCDGLLHRLITIDNGLTLGASRVQPVAGHGCADILKFAF